MGHDGARSSIDFTSYVADATRDFTGREWVFAAIDDWLAPPATMRHFLLTGEPGSGKTALVQLLPRLFEGTVSFDGVNQPVAAAAD